ncbi:PcsB-like coiled-coil domain-containing protein [Oceanobacillus damuensis]|uniref:PcsB-like coiled-coil domain-containing protein n=1 Tax=Oceanobacillus damuensis TaxID=937928 RepID=UPI00083332C2|nr:3D domain-containing protein [Oceanobacillus damuensis]
MRKALLVMTAFIVIVSLGGSFFSVPIFAESVTDLEEIRDDRDALKGNLSESEREVAQILAELEQLNNEIQLAHDKLIENQNAVEETERNIEDTLADISQLEEEKKELEAKIEERHEILKGRIVSTQKTGGKISYLEVIFGSKSFDDFISRVTAVNKIADSDAALIEQQKNDMQQVEEKQTAVLDKLNELNEMKLAQKEAEAEISQQILQNDERKANLENKKQQLTAFIDELEMEDSVLASLEKEVKLSLAAAETAKSEAESANEEETGSDSDLVQVASVEPKQTKAVKEQPEEKTPVKPVNEQPKKEVKETKAEPEKEVKAEPKEEKKDSKTLTMTSTAYTADCAGCSGVTSTGIDLNKNPDAKVIAVDPAVIPLGSVVYVEGYGYATAGDTGGAIKGNKIDVFVQTKKEALNWGVRTVKVTLAE